MDSVSYLKLCNIKITKGRVCILDVLINCEKAVSVDYVFEAVKNKGVFIDLSTVYRTLDILVDKHIIDKFDLGDGKYNYILKEGGHKHILECSLCHKELEIDCPMKQIEQLITNKTGFTSFQHEFKIKGICEECNNSKVKK